MIKRKVLVGIISASLLIQPMAMMNVYAVENAEEAQILKVGIKNEEVMKLQQRLKLLGYFDKTVTGFFGKLTEEAVEKFQSDNKLQIDGIVGKDTMRALFSTEDENYSVSRGMRETRISEWNWFGGIDKIIQRGTTFKVTDIKTGKEFYAKRTYGTNHADSETLTKEDTKIMKELYGSWSWDRRAIIVEVDGMQLPASMAGMPHGSDFIENNGMNGHFDIHFLNSKTHGTNSINPAHQEMIRQANAYLAANQK
ncbi:hypothetical protein HNQ80_001530 [Anaerosolibacter carboniphilus]|uniref:Peptidoglycan binding-like domain-containing protein n=1 Tax=Anaerosolibacter carboniphilus TaxID=1417629 RepID=A0A841KQ31_9FIRM|nr:peptidoglycan-binding domain-containing protein [Anaerosolibacter carboniphilus]MBB6215441.1 hypothetical protein [Anaerosolibacter carboniphilus]